MSNINDKLKNHIKENKDEHELKDKHEEIKRKNENNDIAR